MTTMYFKRYVVKLQKSKILQCLLIVYLSCFIYVIYRLQQYDSFSTISDRYRKNTVNKIANDGLLSVLNDGGTNTGTIDVMITFTKAEYNTGLQIKFKTCLMSLFYFSSVHVELYIIGDNASKQIAAQILSETVDKSKYTVCLFLIVTVNMSQIFP